MFRVENPFSFAFRGGADASSFPSPAAFAIQEHISYVPVLWIIQTDCKFTQRH
jgi:hypothetical protein